MNKFRFFMLIILYAFFFHSSSKLFEEEYSTLKYSYSDFDAFLGLSREDTYQDPLLYTIKRSFNIEGNENSIYEKFPAYRIVREMQNIDNSYDDKYIVYDLSDDSALFIFIEDEKPSYICRMMPRCTTWKFRFLVKKGLSPADVINIDENTVFNPFIQWRPVSFHCLSDGSFWRVIYKQSRENRSEYFVDSITMIPQNECYSVLRYIHINDMP